MRIQKRLAAKILGIGKSRIWISPESEDVRSALTSGDIRKFIGLGHIQVKEKKGNSRGRTRFRQEQRKKGRQRGYGKRKGTSKSRLSSKKNWMKQIRAQRKTLRELRDSEKIPKALYRKTYSLAKAGVFRDKAQIKSYLKERSKEK